MYNRKLKISLSIQMEKREMVDVISKLKYKWNRLGSEVKLFEHFLLSKKRDNE